LKIAVPKETKPYEKRVALTPDVVKSLTKAGFTCYIENGAGFHSNYLDEAYQRAGAAIVPASTDLFREADIVLKVNAPSPEEISLIKPGAVLISFLYAYTIPGSVQALLDKQVSAFAMDAVPRISRAQKMDALSSQANLAGYKAVLLGANHLAKIFPLMMTAAGTITPAKVLIFGAGVAGLQAIATAKRLGAVVEVTDVRPETKEQVESLGGRFLEVKSDEGVKTEGGYAREVSAEYLQKQKELVSKHVAEADLVITTALVMGRKAPVLITEDMVKTMKPGAVIVDMAVESGGNCALSELNQTVVKYDVTIIGESNLPAQLAMNASDLYAKNISTLLLQGSLITHKGELVHTFTRDILSKQAEVKR
jgi:NAD(P) transhydrogenase subunit alpha